MWADPIVTRHIGGHPLTEEESWSRFLRYAGHWAMLGFGYWVVEEKSTRSFAGEVGFADHKRDLQPPFVDRPEIGWVISPSFHGKGYATEAVRAAAAWGDTHFGSRRTACLIHPDNFQSIRVAEKCGYRKSEPATYKGRPALVFVR
jgi:RimJ/RimL family protein N-acetyltransferase